MNAKLRRRLTKLGRWLTSLSPGPNFSSWGGFVKTKQTTPETMERLEMVLWYECRSTLIKLAFLRSWFGIFNRNQLVMPQSLQIIIKRPVPNVACPAMFSTVAWRFDTHHFHYLDHEQRVVMLHRTLPAFHKLFRERFKEAQKHLTETT